MINGIKDGTLIPINEYNELKTGEYYVISERGDGYIILSKCIGRFSKKAGHVSMFHDIDILKGEVFIPQQWVIMEDHFSTYNFYKVNLKDYPEYFI